jgi:hypothetical protein
LCGTTERVRAPFVTIWNGNSVDLCIPCAVDTGLVALLDKIDADRGRPGAARRQGILAASCG